MYCFQVLNPKPLAHLLRIAGSMVKIHLVTTHLPQLCHLPSLKLTAQAPETCFFGRLLLFRDGKFLGANCQTSGARIIVHHDFTMFEKVFPFITPDGWSTYLPRNSRLMIMETHRFPLIRPASLLSPYLGGGSVREGGRLTSHEQNQSSSPN